MVQQALVVSDAAAALFRADQELDLRHMDVLALLRREVVVFDPALCVFLPVLNVVIYVLLLDFLLDQAAASLLNLEILVTKEGTSKLTGLLEVKWKLSYAVLEMIQIDGLAPFETEVRCSTLLKVLQTSDVVNTRLLDNLAGRRIVLVLA